MTYDFSKPVNRRDTNSMKWDVAENELPMWVADMDFETCPAVKEAIIQKAQLGVYGYTIVPDSYLESVMNWWKTYHHFELKKEWILFSTGVVPAISSIVRKMTTPAENVLIQSPVYNIFYNSIYNNGRNILSSDLVFDGKEYHIDFEDLEAKLADPQTTLMILCNPHNPIGKIWDKETLKRIGHLCAKHHVLVLSDEIHCDLCQPGLEYVPFASVDDVCRDNSITCVAASKAFNLAGLQSASVIVPNPLLRHKVNRGLNTDEVAEPNAFCIEANTAAFTKGRAWLEDLCCYIEENKKYARAFIEQQLPMLYVVPSEATYLLWVDCHAVCEDGDQLCEFIRKETGLFVSSGEEYGKNGRSFMRINLACPKSRVEDGMRRLKKGIEAFLKTV